MRRCHNTITDALHVKAEQKGVSSPPTRLTRTITSRHPHINHTHTGPPAVNDLSSNSELRRYGCGLLLIVLGPCDFGRSSCCGTRLLVSPGCAATTCEVSVKVCGNYWRPWESATSYTTAGMACKVFFWVRVEVVGEVVKIKSLSKSYDRDLVIITNGSWWLWAIYYNRQCTWSNLGTIILISNDFSQLCIYIIF